MLEDRLNTMDVGDVKILIDRITKKELSVLKIDDRDKAYYLTIGRARYENEKQKVLETVQTGTDHESKDIFQKPLSLYTSVGKNMSQALIHDRFGHPGEEQLK